MKKREELQLNKKKSMIREEMIKLTLDNEVGILLQYLKLMPITIRAQFSFGLKKITDDPRINRYNRQKILHLLAICSNLELFDETRNQYLVNSFFKFLGFRELAQYYKQLRIQGAFAQRKNQSQKQSESFKKSMLAFEPNIVYESQYFNPIQGTINPNYQNIIKMWRLFTDTHFNNQYKYKDLNQHYTFYAQPRFFLKMDQLRQFQTGFPEKGNIVMITFQGNQITGGKGFAIVEGNNIYWWQKRSKGIKQIISEMTDQREKQQIPNTGKQKPPAATSSNNKKQQKIQYQQYAQPSPTNPSLNFQLYFKMVGHTSKITTISLSADQFYLISAGTDHYIKLWCLRSKMLLCNYLAHLSTIWSIQFSQSGYFFVSGGADKIVKLWATDQNKPRRVYNGHKEDVLKVGFMRNPDLLISAGQDKEIRIWNTMTTQCVKVFLSERPIINFALSISGRYMVSCDTKGKISLYDFYQGQLINSFVIPEKDYIPENKNTQNNKNLKIHDMCFSYDQKQFACVSSRYIMVYSFDKLCEKPAKNIYAQKQKNNLQKNIATKQVIYTGRDTNLTYCGYHDKGILVVASSIKPKY